MARRWEPWASGPQITARPGDRVLRGLAVPFNDPVRVPAATGRERNEHGDIILEVFDELSVPVTRLPVGVPLLHSHLDANPIGTVTEARIAYPLGITFEAKLALADAELEAMHRRFAQALLTGVSIGFFASPRDDLWERAPKPGQPPLVRRRNVEIREVSLVQWPAYPSAGLREVAARTGAADRATLLAQKCAALAAR